MARISTGDFGNVIARPTPQVAADPNAYGAGVGRVLEQAGSIGMQSAARDMAVADAEAKQLAREQAAEAKAAANEAKRVKALTAQATIGNSLNALNSEIEAGLADGTIDKAKAPEIYATRSQKIVDGGIEGVDENHRELVRATVLGDLGRGQQQVSKLVTARNKADIKTGGMAYIEEMQRFAARGTAEADQAIANVKKFWTATGPMAGEDPAQAAARVQQFAEKVRYQQASSLVNTDPGAALRALKDAKYLPELDPGQRTSLIHTADTRVLQAQQRAEIRARADEARLTREWTAVSTVLDAGKALDPAYAATMLKKFKGTPYEAAFTQLTAEGPATAAFASQPVALQRRMLDEMQGAMNREGATPDQIKRYQKAEKAHSAAVAEIKADPFAAAAERGVIKDIAPLSIDLAKLPQQLMARAHDAEAVSHWAGAEVSLFRPQEAAKVGELLSALPARDRANMLSGISKVMTPGQMRALGVQLGAKDSTLAAAAILSAQGAKTTAGRLVSEIVLTGADAIKEQRLKWPAGQDQTSVRAEIDKITRGAFLSEDGNRAAGDAALAVYAGLLAEGGTPDAGQAVRLVTGGIMESNGQKIIKPHGWTDGMVQKALRDVDGPRVAAITGGKSAQWGDKELAPDDLAKLMPGAQLGPTGKPGAYTVSIGGRMVMANGRPLVVPLGDR
jgi:hypothetical protein